MNKEIIEVEVRSKNPYKVYIGNDFLEEIPSMIERKIGDAKKIDTGSIAIITDENVDKYYGEKLLGAFEKTNFSKTIKYVIPPGETSKSFDQLEKILDFLSENHIRRNDYLIAFGGGVVGDIAGLAAGLYQRGMPYVQVPTSLLAAVDSSVGGKTAINIKQGKNMVGIFYQPQIVCCDTSLFKSMEEKFFKDGVAEIIKYAILKDKNLFNRLSNELRADDNDLKDIVARCVQIKADIVNKDEFDRGIRQVLNLGHTIGHAIEAASKYRVSHGQAVAIGMSMISRAAVKKGFLDQETKDKIINVIQTNKLATEGNYETDKLYEAASRDKKFIGSSLNIIIPEDIARCKILEIEAKDLINYIELGKEIG